MGLGHWLGIYMLNWFITIAAMLNAGAEFHIWRANLVVLSHQCLSGAPDHLMTAMRTVETFFEDAVFAEMGGRRAFVAP